MKKNIVFKAILRALTYHPDSMMTPRTRLLHFEAKNDSKKGF